MVATRSSQQSSSATPASSHKIDPVVGDKRKAEASPSQKSNHAETSSIKKQKTLEETLGKGDDIGSTAHDADASHEDRVLQDGNVEQGNLAKDKDEAANEGSSNQSKAPQDALKARTSSQDVSADDTSQRKSVEIEADRTAQDSTAIDPSGRNGTPNSIIEKGLIYFFFRGRVGIDDPSNTNEIARSYVVLRPIPHRASLQKASLDPKEPLFRVLALPKKVLPVTPRDRYMVFVEHASATADSIKENVLKSNDDATKSAGTRHTPAATPIASGVYGITATGRETHLAYMLTLQGEGPSEVQKDIGLKARGSFVVSVKNPQYPGPANTNLPSGPDFPQDILDEFRSLRWTPLQAKMLNYENTQLLLIGTHADGNDLSVAEPEKLEHGEEGPVKELERLEGEDGVRAAALKDDTVFEDLALSHEEYGNLQTTWD